MRRYLIHIDLSAGRWPFSEMHCDLSALGSAGRHGMAVCVRGIIPKHISDLVSYIVGT